MLDVKNLEEKLESLTGYDYETARRYFRLKNKDFFGVEQLNSEFQAEVAALALGANVNELKELPMKKYAKICNGVQRFLISSDDEEDAAVSLEKPQ